MQGPVRSHMNRPPTSWRAASYPYGNADGRRLPELPQRLLRLLQVLTDFLQASLIVTIPVAPGSLGHGVQGLEFPHGLLQLLGIGVALRLLWIGVEDQDRRRRALRHVVVGAALGLRWRSQVAFRFGGKDLAFCLIGLRCGGG